MALDNGYCLWRSRELWLYALPIVGKKPRMAAASDSFKIYQIPLETEKHKPENPLYVESYSVKFA